MGQEAQDAADSLVADYWTPGESAEEFALRMSQLQQKIAACQSVVNIPRRAIDAAEGAQK
jgi:hypothetical protein